MNVCQATRLPIDQSGGPALGQALGTDPGAGVVLLPAREGLRADADWFRDGFQQTGRGVVDVAGDGGPC